MKRLLPSRRTPYETQPSPSHSDTHVGSVAVKTEAEKPEPTFADMLEAAGKVKDPGAFMTELATEAKKKTPDSVNTFIRALNLLPNQTRFGVAITEGGVSAKIYLPTHGDRVEDSFGAGQSFATFIANGRPDFPRHQAGIGLSSINLAGQAERAMSLVFDVGEVMHDHTLLQIPLPFDEQGKPQFQFNVELP